MADAKRKIRSKGGRPTKLTPRLQKRLCEAIANGMTYQAACDSVKLAVQTFYKWRRHGERTPRGMFGKFCDAIQEAEERAIAKVEAAHYEMITEGYLQGDVKTESILDAQGNPTGQTKVTRTEKLVKSEAGMRWFLERRAPERYPSVKVLEHTGAINVADRGPIEIKLAGVKALPEESETEESENA